MKITALFFALLAVSALPVPAEEKSSKTEAVETSRVVTPDEVEKAVKTRKDVLVLDIRTEDEFSDGHIPGARNIDFLGSDFAEQIANLDPSKTYVVHCASGSRSSSAQKIFQDHKLKVLHLKSGFKGWKDAGKRVVKFEN